MKQRRVDEGKSNSKGMKHQRQRQRQRQGRHMKQRRVVRGNGNVKGMKHLNPSVVERRGESMKRSGVGVGRSKGADFHSTYSAAGEQPRRRRGMGTARSAVCAARRPGVNLAVHVFRAR